MMRERSDRLSIDEIFDHAILISLILMKTN
jgi:hypothetical protein